MATFSPWVLVKYREAKNYDKFDVFLDRNDPAAQVHEVMAYWDAVKAVKTYVDENPGTVMLSVCPSASWLVIEDCQRSEQTFPRSHRCLIMKLVDSACTSIVSTVYQDITGFRSIFR